MDDDEEDEDLRLALEASKRESTAVSNPPTHQRPPPATTSNPAAAFLSERAKLEQERLERLKRTRPDIHRDTTAITVDSDSEDDIDEEERARSAKRQHISSSSSGARRANLSTPLSSTRNVPSTSAAARARPTPATGRQTQAAGSIFWEGELRQTANMHVDKHKDTRPVFRLSEIISPVGICLCIPPGYITGRVYTCRGSPRDGPHPRQQGYLRLIRAKRWEVYAECEIATSRLLSASRFPFGLNQRTGERAGGDLFT